MVVFPLSILANLRYTIILVQPGARMKSVNFGGIVIGNKLITKHSGMAGHHLRESKFTGYCH